MGKQNYNDIGAPLDFRRENDFKITTLLQRYTRSESRSRKHIVATTLVFGRSNDIRSTTLSQSCDNVIRHRDQKTTKTQLCYNVACQLGMLFILYARINYDLNTIVNLKNRRRSMLMRKLSKKKKIVKIHTTYILRRNCFPSTIRCVKF